MSVVCVEMYDGRTFCGGDDHYIGVGQRDWHESVGVVRQATCLRCLSRIEDLGYEASLARAAALRDDHTEASQAAWAAQDQKRRNAERKASGDTTLTLASFNDMLKAQYDP